MPPARVQTRPARVARAVARVHLGNTEESDVDVCSPRPQLAVANLDHGGAGNEQCDDGEAHAHADQERDRRADRHEDERRHRRRDGRRNEEPQ